VKKQNWDLFKEAAKKAIEHHGGKVGVHSPECVSYRDKHTNCFGCTYERDCTKFVKILELSLQNEPDLTTIDKLIDAVTVEDARAVRIDLPCASIRR